MGIIRIKSPGAALIPRIGPDEGTILGDYPWNSLNIFAFLHGLEQQTEPLSFPDDAVIGFESFHQLCRENSEATTPQNQAGFGILP